MSQINVDTVLPFTSGVNVVTVKNAKIALNNDTLQICSLGSLSNATQTTIIGKGAAPFSTGSANTFVGYNSGASATSSSANTFIGAVAGGQVTTGINNTCVGNQAGNSITSGNSNTFIGAGAGISIPGITGQNLIVIQGNPSASNISNEITLGNAFIGALRCAATTITSLSDARDKKDITDLRAGLDFVKSLRPVEFVWDDRDEEGRHDVLDFGFIAQDLKAAQEDIEMSETLKLVYESNPERLEASYGKLVPVLVQAIKDLAAKVETLENKKK
jgi:hypothetical protein